MIAISLALQVITNIILLADMNYSIFENMNKQIWVILDMAADTLHELVIQLQVYHWANLLYLSCS